jgi:hypothetical protein
MKAKIGWGISLALVAALIVVGVVVVRLALREEPLQQTATTAAQTAEEIDLESLALLSEGGGEMKLLVLGVEGLDWEFLRPLLDQGMLPNLASIIDRAATGRLSSEPGDRHKNLTWTNIATGRNPEKHRLGQTITTAKGGEGQVSPLLGSFGRAGKAIWNILSTAGIKVGLVGWPGSFPAEPVRGFVVVSYDKYYLQLIHEDRLEELNFPPSLLDQTRNFFYNEEEFVPDDFSRFLNVEPGQESVLSRVFLSFMTKAYCSDRTIADLWLHLAEKYNPRAGFVWLGGSDVARSSFYHFTNLDPEEFEAQAPDHWKNIEPIYNALKDVDIDFIRFTDEMIGQILETVTKNTTIVLISEHGYRKVDVQPGWAPVAREELYSDHGILAIAGPGIDPGTQLGEVSQYDIVPTVLALFGLPKAEDMDGDVLEEAFDQNKIAEFPSEEISTYDTPGFKPERTRPVQAIDPQLENRLKSLGYIQ